MRRTFQTHGCRLLQMRSFGATSKLFISGQDPRRTVTRSICVQAARLSAAGVDTGVGRMVV